MDDYKFNDGRGAFMGSHFEYDEGRLLICHNVAVNMVAGVLHKAHSLKKTTYTKGMTYQDFYNANKQFFITFINAFKKKRHYELTYTDIREGIIDFLERMEYINTKLV